MKKKLLVVLCVTILALAASIVALSAATEPTFNFSLKVDGKNEKTAMTDDYITVVFTLERTDANESYTMHAFQNEIRYDSTFFELVEDSYMLKSGISYPNIKVSPYEREQYMNYLSLSGGSAWKPKTMVGSFQLRVIAESGASLITNEDCSVSRKDGSSSYTVTDEDVLIIVSNELTVTFDSKGGSAVASQTLTRGDKLTRPADPTREGYTFKGWFTDENGKNEWNFDDTVEYNLHLYARWEKASDVKPVDPTPEVKFPFTDVTEADWYYASVKYAYENGLMKGVSDTLFDPNGSTTRAMIVTIIHRLEGSPKSDANMPFADVEASTWYADPVRWASANEIVKGVSDTAFAPNTNITREQMVTFMWRLAKYKGYDVSVDESVTLDSFTDVSSISPYAVEAMRWAYSRGLINGMGDGTIAPQGTATRAQVAAIFMRYRENIK